MELRQLRYFVAVAEELHFGRAAERLVIAQSAVSQQISRLERELGTELFVRTPRRVRLSEAGAVFLPAAREVLAAEQYARATLSEFTAARGAVLRIGTSRGMGDRLVRVLEALNRTAPGTRVELASAAPQERLRRVGDGEWDAAFVRGVLAAPRGVRQVPVWRDELLVALPAGHPLADPGGVDLARLAGLPLYLTRRRDNPPLVDLVLAACREAGFEPVLEAPGMPVQDILAALGAGAGGWTVVYAAHARQLRNDRVAFVPARAPGTQDDASPGLSLPTVLAMRDSAAGLPGPLLAACRQAARGDRDS